MGRMSERGRERRGGDRSSCFKPSALAHLSPRSAASLRLGSVQVHFPTRDEAAASSRGWIPWGGGAGGSPGGASRVRRPRAPGSGRPRQQQREGMGFRRAARVGRGRPQALFGPGRRGGTRGAAGRLRERGRPGRQPARWMGRRRGSFLCGAPLVGGEARARPFQDRFAAAPPVDCGRSRIACPHSPAWAPIPTRLLCAECVPSGADLLCDAYEEQRVAERAAIFFSSKDAGRAAVPEPGVSSANWQAAPASSSRA